MSVFSKLKRGLTTASNRAKKALEDASILLTVEINKTAIKHLETKIADLREKKKDIMDAEAESEQLLAEDPTANESDEAKAALEKEIQDHLLKCETEETKEKIDEAISLLESRIEMVGAYQAGRNGEGDIHDQEQAEEDDRNANVGRGRRSESEMNLDDDEEILHERTESVPVKKSQTQARPVNEMKSMGVRYALQKRVQQKDPEHTNMTDEMFADMMMNRMDRMEENQETLTAIVHSVNEAVDKGEERKNAQFKSLGEQIAQLTDAFIKSQPNGPRAEDSRNILSAIGQMEGPNHRNQASFSPLIQTNSANSLRSNVNISEGGTQRPTHGSVALARANQEGNQTSQDSMLQQYGISERDLDVQIKMEQMKATIIQSTLSTITPFSGEEADYATFMAQFDAMVHLNRFIDFPVKQSMLVKLLPRELATEHQMTAISEENYWILRRNLDEQFNMQMSQRNNLFKTLHTTKFPTQDLNKLASALHTYATNARKLQAFGVNPNDPYFLSSLVNKLPKVVRTAAYKKMEAGQSTLREVMMAAHRAITRTQGLENLEKSQENSQDDERYTTNVNSAQGWGPNRAWTPTRQMQQPKYYGGRRPKFIPPSKAHPCAYCGDQAHRAVECDLPTEQKLQAVIKKGLCSNCLSTSHVTTDCQSKFNCFNCHKRHFTGHCQTHKTQIKSLELIANFDDDKGLEEHSNEEESESEDPDNPSSNRSAQNRVHFNSILKTEVEEDTEEERFHSCIDGQEDYSSGSEEGDSEIYLALKAGETMSSIPTNRTENSTPDQSKTDQPSTDQIEELPSTIICNEITTAEKFGEFIKMIHTNPQQQEPPIRINIQQITDAQAQLPFVQLQTPNGNKLLALADSGAQMSIISTKAAEALQLQIVGRRMMSYSGFVADTGQRWCTFYRLELRDLQGNCWVTCVPSFERMNTTFTAPHHSDEDVVYLNENGLNFQGVIDLRDLNGTKIDMILGNNILNKIRKMNYPKMYALPSGRTIEQVILGYINHPPVKDDSLIPLREGKPIQLSTDINTIWIHTIDTEMEMEDKSTNTSSTALDKQLEQMWSLEAIGLHPPEARESKEKLNQELIEEFKKSAILDPENRIFVALPHNGRESELYDNLPVAKRRLASLLERQLNKESLREEYHTIIRKQLESGIIEEAPEESIPGRPQYYIPHRVVVKEDSTTTKLRIVLDASSHMKGELSLNDTLHPGPSILQSILGILLRSRTEKYLMIADLEKAFHKVRIQEPYRDVTRFLWLRDPSKGSSEDNIVTYRFTRLPFGLTCSPFLLAVTILKYLDMFHSCMKERIKQNLYVDNVLFTSESEEDMKMCYEESKRIFEKMHMNLREFLCNSQAVMKEIKEGDEAPDHTYKLLGHIWDSVKDTITIKIATPPKGKPTKRQIVAFAAKNYDPSGIICPLIVKLKKLIALLWEDDINWNDELTSKLEPMWEEVKAQFTSTTYTIPRRISTSPENAPAQLILFADASKDHFATTAYMRYSHPDGSYSSGLIFAKSRIRPRTGSTQYTIPRMELLALEMTSNAAITIKEELRTKINRVAMFSDSKCCLYWVLNRNSNTVGSLWVCNRVKRIQENLKILTADDLSPTMRYVQTDQNPADIASRGCSLKELEENDLWKLGPDFIRKPEEDWPQQLEKAIADPHEFREYADAMGIGETKGDEAVERQKNLVVSTISGATHSFIPYERTHSLKKLTTWVAKAMDWICRITQKRNKRYPDRPIIFKDPIMKSHMTAVMTGNSAERLLTAKRAIIRHHYKDAEDRLGETLPKGIVPVQHLDGSIRHETRFSKAEDVRLTPEMRYPIVIINKHPLATLLVIDAHQRLNHQGNQDVITEVHKKYFIDKLAALVKKVRDRCVKCRRKHARAFRYEYARLLPPSRTTMIAPFRFIGLDYFGPLPYQRNDGEGKMWVLLITCLTTRAVHLEQVPDNSTISFIHALNRFIARRGTPEYILSDNARAFKLGYDIINKDMRTIVAENEELTSFLAKNEIRIKLITPLSPWQGGIYERLVGLVKTMLIKVLGKSVKPYLEMHNLIVEAEGIINGRPLTPNKKSPDDSPVIRPIDFIVPGAQLALPENCNSIFDRIKPGETEKLSRQTLESISKVKEELWIYFADHYFQTIKEIKKSNTLHSRLQPRKGMIVLVDNSKHGPRHTWPIGRIIRISRELDGQPRSVIVKVGKKEYEKPVNQLYPLEDPGEESEPEFINVPEPATSSYPTASQDRQHPDQKETQEVPNLNETPKRKRGRPRKVRPIPDQKVSKTPSKDESSRSSLKEERQETSERTQRLLRRRNQKLDSDAAREEDKGPITRSQTQTTFVTPKAVSSPPPSVAAATAASYPEDRWIPVRDLAKVSRNN